MGNSLREAGDTVPMPLRSGVRLQRAKAVARLRRELELLSFPRIQMGLIVALTGAAGLLCSFLLLRAGMHSMVLRYPLALAGAYMVFLLLLWLWLRTKASDYADAQPDLLNLVPDLGNVSHGGNPLSFHAGGGGDFGGGGADGSFDLADAAVSSVADAPGSDAGEAAGEVAGAIGSADELAIPIVAIVLALGLALASLYVVYLAPGLFAEILFDGALSYTLYRRLRRRDSPHWLSTAFGHTAWPFGITAVFLVLVGAAMAAYAPGARSIGEVVHYVKPAR